MNGNVREFSLIFFREELVVGDKSLVTNIISSFFVRFMCGCSLAATHKPTCDVFSFLFQETRVRAING